MHCIQSKIIQNLQIPRDLSQILYMLVFEEEKRRKLEIWKKKSEEKKEKYFKLESHLQSYVHIYTNTYIAL